MHKNKDKDNILVIIMDNNEYTEIASLCDKHNVTLVDFGTTSIFPECTKKQTYIRFICESHQKYGIQERHIYDFKRLNCICRYCSHSMLKETFVEEMSEINLNIQILSDYINSDTKIKCKCMIDGYEWEAFPMALLHQKTGCKICGCKKRDAMERATTQEFVLKMASVNSNIDIIGEYIGAHKLIKCKCKIDNKEWESYACNLLNGSAKCPECDIRHKREAQSLSVAEINMRLESNGVNARIIDGYLNNKSKVKCFCTIHNITYMASAKTLLYNKSSGCPECVQSLGEVKMLRVLKQMGYNIVPQYVFEDCKYINALRFDGYDMHKNIAFEYQGQQHYHPIDFSGSGKEYAYQEFQTNMVRDNIKREYCKNHNIHLIEIPYWKYNDMESFLYKQLDQR